MSPPRTSTGRRSRGFVQRLLIAGVAATSALVSAPRGWGFAAQLGGRRKALFAASIASAAGVAPAGAYELDSNRVAQYDGQSRLINDAADWWLFELQPLVFPSEEVLAMSDCERDGIACPEIAGLSVVYEMFTSQGASRSGQVILSKVERDVVTPLKVLATSAVFDPDLSDELNDDAVAFEKTTMYLGQAARKADLKETRAQFTEGKRILNNYFKKVNDATGLPSNAPTFLSVMPTEKQTLENEYYWQRRQQKYVVKKKVDAVSKGNKSARFYAKAIFGDDAVSWDPRGDRAGEFSK